MPRRLDMLTLVNIELYELKKTGKIPEDDI